MSTEDGGASGAGPRARLRRAGLQVGYLARHRCAALRSALQHETTELSRRDLAGFPARVRRLAAATVEEVDADISAALAGVVALTAPTVTLTRAGRCPQPPLPAPPAARPLEARLTRLLGTGFGMGAGLSLTRLLTEITPATTPAELAAGAAAGLAVASWLVSVRGLLQRRALLERWVGEVAATLRAVTAQRIATRMLAARTVLAAASAEGVRPLHPDGAGHDNLY